MANYEASSIVVFDGLDIVRFRPGMYVGDVHDGSALHHMLWEVLGNAVNEHLGGHASEVFVRLHDGEITIDDNGRGIPVEPLPSGESFLEIILTRLCGSSTRNGQFLRGPIGSSLYGPGIAAVNALSSELEVETHTGGQAYRLAFARGKKVGPLVRLGGTRRRGTRLRLRPDPTIFTRTEFDVPLVRARLWELACLNPALSLRFEHGTSEHLRAPGGLTDFVRAELAGEGAVDCPFPKDPLRIRSAHRDVEVEVALQWRGDGRPRVHGFANQHGASGGSHVDGLWAGLCGAFAKAVPDEGLSRSVARELVGAGLTAAVSVGLYAPRFGASMRVKRLESPEALLAVSTILERDLAGVMRAFRARRPS